MRDGNIVCSDKLMMVAFEINLRILLNFRNKIKTAYVELPCKQTQPDQGRYNIFFIQVLTPQNFLLLGINISI